AIHGRNGYRAVLVSIPEFVKQPKPVSLVAIPALVWLFVVEFGNEILIDQPQAIGTVSMPRRRRLSDRKTDFAPRGTPGRSRRLRHRTTPLDGQPKRLGLNTGDFNPLDA